MLEATYSAILVYLVAIVLLVLTRSRHVPGRAAVLLRALFPSWRFFEDIVEVPVLRIRVDDESEWHDALPNLERRLESLFLNPTGNLHHALGTLLHQLSYDLESVSDKDPEAFEESVSYRLVENAVRVLLPSNATQFQFKVTAIYQARPSEAGTDILVSRRLDV